MATNQSNTLPPPPTREPLLNANGQLSSAWWVWFTQLFNRVGSGFSATNTDLEILDAFQDIPKSPEGDGSSIFNAINTDDQNPNKDIQDIKKLNALQEYTNTSWDKKLFDIQKEFSFSNNKPNGNIRGPNTFVTNGNLAVWDGTTGKYIKDGGVPASSVVTSVSGTADRITSTGGTTPIIDIAANYVGQTSLVILGTVTTGTWNAGAVTSSGVVQGTRLISTIAIGTAPFTVTSTTLVPNLYVARSVLSDTVTTNANLTGAVASTGNATLLGSFTSAQLLAALTDETGTGVNVFGTSPTITTSIGIGAAPAAGRILPISASLTGSSTSIVAFVTSDIKSDVTSSAFIYRSSPTVENASFTIPDLYHNSVFPGTYGALATITRQYGFYCASTLTGAATNYGFFSNIALSGATRYNFYAAGTAPNYFEGIIQTNSGRIVKTRVVTAAGAITVATTDYYIGVNKTVGAATTVNLPASPATGTAFIIKDEKGDAATNNITLTPAAGNIDNAGTFVMVTNNQSVIIIYNGTQWTCN